MNKEITYQSFYHYLVYKFQHIPGIGFELYKLFNNQRHDVEIEVQDEILRLKFFLHISETEFPKFEYLLHLTPEEYRLQFSNAKVIQTLIDRGCEVILNNNLVNDNELHYRSERGEAKNI